MRSEQPKPYRVLAVDNDQTMLTLYRDVLCLESETTALEAIFGGEGNTTAFPDGSGFELKTCTRGDEAEQEIKVSLEQTLPYSVIFMDINLEDGPDGVSSAEHIRKLDPNVEIVIISAHTDIPLGELNRRIPPSEKLLYVHKPVRPQELRQMATSLCGKWEAEYRLRELNETLATQVENRTKELNSANEKLKRDLMERTRVYRELMASEERYRLLFEKDITGNFTASPDGIIHECNEALARMFGYDSTDDIPSSDLLTRPVDTKGGSLLDRMLSKGESPKFETVLHKANGAPVHVFGGFQTLRDSDGNPSEIRGYFFDISQRKELEEQLRQAQKMEALGTLAGGIAHDFNNILGVIMGYAEIIKEGSSSDSGLVRRVGEILSAGNRARDLVNQILNFSRQGFQERMPLNFTPLIKETLKLLKSSLPRNVEIVSDFRSEDDMVTADPSQLHQILLNLCANAGHAMTETGGVLTVSLADADDGPPAPPSGLDSAKWFLRLSVEDTGHGVPPNVLERIFDPFFTTKKPGEGTGMGLAVAHGIVKSYGGTITAESTPGQGASFHVYLPKSCVLERASTTEDTILLPDKGRIMFVDDEKPLVDIGREMLEGFGFEVVSRTSSIEALEAFRFRPGDFDLIISDQAMPNMSGFDMAREILKIRPEMPIILCTGFSEGISYERVKEAGIGDLVMKPILKHELIRSIGNLLGDATTSEQSNGLPSIVQRNN